MSAPHPDNAHLRSLIESVTPAARRRDAETLVELFSSITGEPAVLWPGKVVGFGRYHYRYDSGREGDAPAASFAPRRAATSIYLLDGVESHSAELAALGEHSVGVGCLYVRDLTRVDSTVLAAVVRASFDALTRGTFPRRARDSG